MENLLEFFKNTVAILIAMRIAVVIGLIIVIAKLLFSFINSPDTKRFWLTRKKGGLRHRNFLKHH